MPTGKPAPGNRRSSYTAPAELIDKAADKAKREDTNLSAVIRDALEDYADDESTRKVDP